MNSLMKNFRRSNGYLHQLQIASIATSSACCGANTLSKDFYDTRDVLTKDTTTFQNVSLVTPQFLKSYLKINLKLKPVESENESEKPVELMRNIASNYDYWIINSQQLLFYYYRIEMMKQRVAFLESINLTSAQKLKNIQKYPPLLLFTFTSRKFNANMVYLRGLLAHTDSQFTHLFYPLTRKLSITKKDMQGRVAELCEALDVKEHAILREVVNIPCFFMDPILLKDISHLFIHKHSMPFYYDIDKHTANVLPPICNLPSLNIKANKYFSNKVTDTMISSLTPYLLTDILDYTYPKQNGVGTPECLSKFLLKAEFEEFKDRTGGQRLKGIRGFNVAPRQY